MGYDFDGVGGDMTKLEGPPFRGIPFFVCNSIAPPAIEFFYLLIYSTTGR